MIDKVAWVLLADGRVLAARSHGKDVFYFPGGKREAGESDLDTLAREVREELTVEIDRSSAEHFGTFEAEAHGRQADVLVRMTCYTADYQGTLAPSAEIAELAWLDYGDRDRASRVVQIILDHMVAAGLVRRP
ncbi:NUDIX hydrolase [Streptoalloteichus tenebrarius]|uniref:NUDIX hydrolase n=1 Tax=Streptoalloteichus tenebrarius (strain ATCC 17920 / DSM 40477 / JCM 4838 / CBS 697.72 / NBRC 16177 / NCIMB 11028 / NRRL B-12390 / A12253. 1 / ISP 5477) TaxID=1933 RepID=UPI0020A2E860|nr:NUDIX domain-containing protein [Streptoalloteichus tenebrarius]